MYTQEIQTAKLNFKTFSSCKAFPAFPLYARELKVESDETCCD